MKENDAFLRFIREHAADDPARLVLAAAKYPEVDVRRAAEQIAIRRQLREKLPTWAADWSLTFPSRLAAEQCSSWQTAAYKQRFVAPGMRVCDLTGGLGVDSYYLAGPAASLLYCERHAAYCEAARHNFAALGTRNITVREGDFAATFDHLPPVDLFYVDPARRDAAGQRVYALAACEPDLTRWLPRLLERAPRVLAKLSPMADVRQCLALLPGTAEVHVLAVRGECKELLFLVERDAPASPRLIRCVHFRGDGAEESFSFTPDEEASAPLLLAPAVGRYLYEPNAAVLKAGAFKSVAMRLGCRQLQVNSHLYTADVPVAGFPGRAFTVQAVIPFHNAANKRLAATYPQANITVRNFPLTVAQLRKKCRIAEGGDAYLFATTLADGERVWICCEKKYVLSRE